jgi:flagellar capping protein FliD
MNKEWMINDIKNALDDSYNNDTIIDLYNLLVEFDNNAVTNSLKEFLKTYNK